MTRCSTSLIIRNYNKTTVRYHYTLIRVDTIKKTDHIPSAGKDTEALDTHTSPSIKPFKK